MLTTRFKRFLDGASGSSSAPYKELYYARHESGDHAFDFSQATDIDAAPDGATITYRKPKGEKTQTMKPGKMVKVLLPTASFTDLELERFTNEFKLHFGATASYRVEIIQGQGIVDAYQTENYSKEDGHYSDSFPLWSSCMRNKNNSILELYTTNPDVCRMAVMKYKDSGIVARALLWQLDAQTVLMDRVYFTKNITRDKLFEWAKANGYWRKAEQSASYRTQLIDPKTGQEVDKKIVLPFQQLPERFPYLDTFTWVQPKDKLLTNYTPPEEVWYYSCASTSGGRSEHVAQVFIVSWDGRRILQHQAVRLDSVNGYHEAHDTVTLPGGEVYPSEHPDICLAHYGAPHPWTRDRFVDDTHYQRKSQCRRVGGLWVEIGHPHYYKTSQGAWVLQQTIPMFAPVTAPDETTTGLWQGEGKPLLPLDTPILTDYAGTRFAKKDPNYGYFMLVDYFGNERQRGWFPLRMTQGKARFMPISEEGEPTTFTHTANEGLAEVLDSVMEEKKKDQATSTSSASRLSLLNSWAERPSYSYDGSMDTTETYDAQPQFYRMSPPDESDRATRWANERLAQLEASGYLYGRNEVPLAVDEAYQAQHPQLASPIQQRTGMETDDDDDEEDDDYIWPHEYGDDDDDDSEPF